MTTFKSQYDYQTFCFSLLYERYIPSQETLQFIDSVVKTAQLREYFISEGTTLWRAQLGADVREDDEVLSGLYRRYKPYKPIRMTPLRDCAHEGRVNPRGIPVLYLSFDRETAMTEVRPWPERLISVAEFVVKYDLRLIDCSRHDPTSHDSTLTKLGEKMAPIAILTIIFGVRST